MTVSVVLLNLPDILCQHIKHNFLLQTEFFFAYNLQVLASEETTTQSLDKQFTNLVKHAN